MPWILMNCRAPGLTDCSRRGPRSPYVWGVLSRVSLKNCPGYFIQQGGIFELRPSSQAARGGSACDNA